MGVRSGVSTWGFLQGLVLQALANPCTSFELHGLDLSPAPLHYAALVAAGVSGVPNLKCVFVQGDALKVQPVTVDILFIDTFHVFGQLRRELSRHAQATARFIIMHDTTVDEFAGEAIRMHINVDAASKSSGIPKSEITQGLWPAVEEFLTLNGKRWRLRERFTHNHGLTILERVAPEPLIFPISLDIDASTVASCIVDTVAPYVKTCSAPVLFVGDDACACSAAALAGFQQLLGTERVEISAREEAIAARVYCLIVFGSVHDSTPFHGLVQQHYAKSEIVILCGEDEPEPACLSSFGTHFKLECEPEPTP